MPRVQGAFLQLVAGATHAFLFALQLRGAQRQQRGGDRKDGGWQQRSGGERAAAKVRGKCAGKHGANCQRGPDAFTAHASRDVIEGERCERHKRRHEDSRDDVGVAAGLAGATGAFSLRDLGQRGDDNAKAKRRDQASIYSKARGGCDAARQHDRFVE